MCQHLIPYSERGQRKFDYPAHRNYKYCRDYAADCGTDAFIFQRGHLENIEKMDNSFDGDENPIKNIFGIFKASNPQDSATQEESQESSSGKTVKVQKKEKNKIAIVLMLCFSG